MAGPLAGADGDPVAPTINIKKMSTVGPLGGAGVVDPRLPTINVKNVDSGHPGPRRGEGSGPHPGSKRCVVKLHRYDR
jgi:hypothetical protein